MSKKLLICVLCGLFITKMQAQSCKLDTISVKRVSTVIVEKNDEPNKPFNITYCRGENKKVLDIYQAVNFLIASLPDDYLNRIKRDYKLGNIYDIPLVENSSLSFVDLYRTLEDIWGFSKDYDNRNKWSKLQANAYKRHLYYNNNFLFEALMMGVWQKLSNKDISLKQQMVNGILIKYDAEFKPSKFSVICNHALEAESIPYSYRFDTGFLRRAHWNYCLDNSRFYFYLFEMGWFQMNDTQIRSVIKDHSSIVDKIYQ